MQAFGLATSVSSSQFGLSTKLPVSVQVSSWVVAGPADGPGWPACSGCSCVEPELLVLSLDHLELGRAKNGVHVLPIVVSAALRSFEGGCVGGARTWRLLAELARPRED